MACLDGIRFSLISMVDAVRISVLQKMQKALQLLGCEDESQLSDWPATKKMPLEVLDQAATAVVRGLVALNASVANTESAALEQRTLGVVGGLTVTANDGPTVAESNQLVANLTKLTVKGNPATKRFVQTVFCQSLHYRRCRDILTAADNSVTPIGEFAFASRRADFEVLTTGSNLETALKYVRLKKSDVVNALEFIQNNCDLSWRNGHIVTRLIGSKKVELPRLKRHSTMGFLFSEYVRWGKDSGVGTVGRHEFSYLLRLVTVEVKEITSASYYFTDGVIDSFKMIGELLKRLKQIAPSTLSNGNAHCRFLNLGFLIISLF
jgi:hypothetical protein